MGDGGGKIKVTFLCWNVIMCETPLPNQHSVSKRIHPGFHFWRNRDA